jgi:hypothetical protein
MSIDTQMEVSMTDDTHPDQPAPQPTDVPGARSPALEPLQALVGSWFVNMTHVALPDPVHGVKTYAWLEGGHFLVERGHFDHPDVPDSVAIIGADDSGEGLAQHYFDSRGVLRVYRMRLSDGIWTLWRDAPGFSQRFTGRFSGDGSTIEVAGELSKDGVKWEPDFTQTYTRGKGSI